MLSSVCESAAVARFFVSNWPRRFTLSLFSLLYFEGPYVLKDINQATGTDRCP